MPSFALFSLLLGVVGRLGTAVVLPGLVLYSLLPIVRNTVTGLLAVDPAVVESAKGVGMGPVRRLLRIELPLAWPVVLAGVRVSAVLLVGIAALGTLVQGPGLGELIFAGLRIIGSPNAVNLALAGTLGDRRHRRAAGRAVPPARPPDDLQGAPMTAPGPAMISLERLTKRYPGQAEPAVRELDLVVPQGEIVVLVGPSGCGKTTTMKMINRIIEPTQRRHPPARGRTSPTARPTSCAGASATSSSRSACSRT